MIEFGLGRISRLLRSNPLPWKAIHVAGTNGKGSVCAYVSAMLKASNVKCGRFTSPHLVDRWDCITIDEQTISSRLFQETEYSVKSRDHVEGIGATEFEILTAIAFEIFTKEKVEVGVVEVGMGGLHDATNVLEQTAVTVITRIGEDHQLYLGDKIEDIALHKAGIMKAQATCLVDGSNTASVINVLRAYSDRVRSSCFRLVPDDVQDDVQAIYQGLGDHEYLPHQLVNLGLATVAVKTLLMELSRPIDLESLLAAAKETNWPGRLQSVVFKEPANGRLPVLLDGAHNVLSAEALSLYTEIHLRSQTPRVTWIVGISQGKHAREILSALLLPGDILIAVPFGPVAGMPWVQAMAPDEIIAIAELVCSLEQTFVVHSNIDDALRVAARIANHGSIVISGSLYLISDAIRLSRQQGAL